MLDISVCYPLDSNINISHTQYKSNLLGHIVDMDGPSKK